MRLAAYEFGGEIAVGAIGGDEIVGRMRVETDECWH